MAVCAVTRHAEHRTRERVGIPKKAVRRAAAKAITKGIRRTETEGGLRRYLDWLYWRGNGEANNIVVYGDKVYLFGNDTLITVLNVPTPHMKQAARLMKKRRKEKAAESVKVYRVEDPVGQHGLWRDFDGTKNPVFDKLTVGKSRTMLMEDSPFYGDGGKRWFAATDEPEKLKAWFDALDIEQLVAMGYGVYEFEVSCVRIVSEYEVVFTRDSIIRKRQINPDTIWGYEMKSEG